MTPPERPAFRVLGEPGARLTPRGCAMVVVALELAARQAGQAGVNYRGRDRYGDFEWLLEVCRAGAVTGGDSAAGTAEATFTVVMPSSAPVPELLTTGQAAAIMRLSTRAVVKRIEAGQLPARKVGREWLITEYDARCAANGGRADARTRTAEDRPGGAEQDTDRPGRSGRQGDSQRADPPA